MWLYLSVHRLEDDSYTVLNSNCILANPPGNPGILLGFDSYSSGRGDSLQTPRNFNTSSQSWQLRNFKSANLQFAGPGGACWLGKFFGMGTSDSRLHYEPCLLS